MGKFWAKNRVRRFTRTVFGAVVQGALLSGLTTVVLTAPRELRLDRVLVGFAGKLLRGDACQKVEEQDEGERPVLDGWGKPVLRYRALTDAAVLRRVGIAPSGVELRVRRLRQYQRWVRRPGSHPQALGAIFGQLP
eukprot:4124882-Pyramimonas_sp.AAC.1